MSRSNDGPTSEQESRMSLRVTYPTLPDHHASPPKANISRRRSQVAALIATPPRAGHAERSHDVFASHGDRSISRTRPCVERRSNNYAPSNLRSGGIRSISRTRSSGQRRSINQSSNVRSGGLASDLSRLHQEPPDINTPHRDDVQGAQSPVSNGEQATRRASAATPVLSRTRTASTPSRFKRAIATTPSVPSPHMPTGGQQRTAHRVKDSTDSRRSHHSSHVAIKAYKGSEDASPATPETARGAISEEDELGQLSPLSPNVEIQRGRRRRGEYGGKHGIVSTP